MIASDYIKELLIKFPDSGDRTIANLAFKKQPKLFTVYGVNQLRWFYLSNMTIPWMTILLATIFYGKIEETSQ